MRGGECPGPPPAPLDPWATGACAACALCGLLHAFLGGRLFKCSLFLTGAAFGGGLVWLLCAQERAIGREESAACAATAAALFGLVCASVVYVGQFVLGLHAGLLLAAASLFAACHLGAVDIGEHVPHTEHVWTCVGVLLGGGVAGAMLALRWRRAAALLSTALYGAALLVLAADYCVERLAALPWLWERVTLRPPQPPPCRLATWLVLAAWPAAAAAGFAAQLAQGATGPVAHRHPHQPRHRRPTQHAATSGGGKRPTGQPLPSAPADTRQTKYRQLYRARTAHGDQISRQLALALAAGGYPGTVAAPCSEPGAGEFSTLQSDATHLTMLPDAHLAALSESDTDTLPDRR